MVDNNLNYLKKLNFNLSSNMIIENFNKKFKNNWIYFEPIIFQ